MTNNPPAGSTVIMQLRKRLESLPDPALLWEACSATDLQSGQVWTLVGTPAEDTPSFLMLVTEKILPGVFNAIPVFRWTELAGPDDLIIPVPLAPIRMVAALGLSCTVSPAMLDTCMGCAPATMMDNIRHALASPLPIHENPAFITGPQWTGPDEHRIAYTTAIGQILEKLQMQHLALPAEEDDQLIEAEATAAGRVIAFPQWLDKISLAAAAGQSLYTPYCVVDKVSYLFRDAAAPDTLSGFAECLAFDPSAHEASGTVFGEWLVSGTATAAPLPFVAFVFDRLDRILIGAARVSAYEKGWLVVLDQHLSALQPWRIQSSTDLHIVLVRENA